MSFINLKCRAFSLTLAASASLGLVGARAELGALTLTTSDDAGEAIVISEQATLMPTAAMSFQFSLTDSAGLIGKFGLTARDVLLAVAPHYQAATLTQTRADTGGHGLTVHESYDLSFGGYPIEGAQLTLHHFKNRLTMVRAAIPDARLPVAPPSAADFLPLSELGYRNATHPVKVLAVSAGFVAPAWRFLTTAAAPAQRRQLVLDAQTGAILSDESLAFDLAAANIYERNPMSGALTPVELPDLATTGYLDGKYFAVYAPTNTDPRAAAPDLAFNFQPNDPAETLFFDQVQAYYAANRAMTYFRQELGYEPDAIQIPVRINMLVDNRADNAQYLRPPQGPEIQVGKGNGVLHDLVRDVDVIAHEFAHHVIYRTLQLATGESGVLHEGTADYFAYAMAGDPYLAESIVAGGLYLRTAVQPDSERFDEWPQSRGAHTRGQLWSAVLWDLRSQLGPAADRLVYESLNYLGKSSGIRDAFLGLINADRDLFPITPGKSGAGVFGVNKCTILNLAVKRGFAAYLDRLDGLDCGLDLLTLGAESRAIMDGKTPMPSGHKGPSIELFGNKCAVVASGRSDLSGWLLLFLAAPLLWARPWRRKEVTYGS